MILRQGITQHSRILMILLYDLLLFLNLSKLLRWAHHLLSVGGLYNICCWDSGRWIKWINKRHGRTYSMSISLGCPSLGLGWKHVLWRFKNSSLHFVGGHDCLTIEFTGSSCWFLSLHRIYSDSRDSKHIIRTKGMFIWQLRCSTPSNLVFAQDHRYSSSYNSLFIMRSLYYFLSKRLNFGQRVCGIHIIPCLLFWLVLSPFSKTALSCSQSSWAGEVVVQRYAVEATFVFIVFALWWWLISKFEIHIYW